MPPPAPQVAKSVEYVQAGVTHLQAAKQLQARVAPPAPPFSTHNGALI